MLECILAGWNKSWQESGIHQPTTYNDLPNSFFLTHTPITHLPNSHYLPSLTRRHGVE
uniref:Uncharacterized protein n=1 Tax=Picea glauca TaxID=3330 RepID=A0A101LUF3_PICGL|nr:hypothetical protein ABT39_MTgene2598 [Picea glauca]QHR87073.1 hypothetical protein Q903MT_gene1082 [Picea sitchensis]